MIKCKNVSKVYGYETVKTEALKSVDLKLKEGQIIVILGPSGSGKSTLLNVISGLDQVSDGTIMIGEEEITQMNQKALTLFRRKNLGFIFQSYHLMPTLTVKENVEMGAYLAKEETNVMEALEAVDMQAHQDKYPHQLSGGEQQRVSIARAIVKKPKILFCDEPTGSLDETTGKKVLSILESLNQSRQTTIVLITHNPSIAAMADQVIKMHSGEIQSVEENKDKKKAESISWA